MHILQLLGHELLVVGTACVANHLAGLLHLLRGGVEALEDRLVDLAEDRAPLERTVLSRLRAVGVHPVHSVLVHKASERLRELLASLVERLARAVAVGAQRVVLGLHHAAKRTHQDAALADEVARDLLLERRRE